MFRQADAAMNGSNLLNAQDHRSAAVPPERLSALLQVRGLRTHFFTDEGVVPAVDGVDLEIAPHRTLGLVGESGCGKSVTGLSVMRLVAPPGRIVAGEVLLRGKDLLKIPESEMRRSRGEDVAMIF